MLNPCLENTDNKDYLYFLKKIICLDNLKKCYKKCLYWKNSYDITTDEKGNQ